jgi:hypothetical protein
VKKLHFGVTIRTLNLMLIALEIQREKRRRDEMRELFDRAVVVPIIDGNGKNLRPLPD